MSLRIDTKHMSQPEGGWSYQVPDGPLLSSLKVGAQGIKELVGQIVSYREANGLPAGDPENDICKEYAPRMPWLILEVPDEDTYANDAESWIHRVWRSFPLGMAEARAKEERFKQCEGCPHFEPLDQDSLSDEAKRRLLLLNPSKFHVEHGWCLLRGWVPSVAVQIHQPIALADDKRNASECWVDVNKKK